MTTALAVESSVADLQDHRRPNLQAIEITGRPYLSHSQLQLMRMCPKRFSFQYVDKSPKDFLLSTLLFGGSIHSALSERFARSSPKRLRLHDPAMGKVICFACVDSITTRKIMWESLRGVVSPWIDGRMAAETLRVLASDRPHADDYYQTTLFDESQALAQSCTARSTIYTANIAAGLMLSQFARWLRQIPVERDLMLNLLSSELVVM